MASRIPITIFNGFLGAGKTTIILNLLQQLEVNQQNIDKTTPTELFNKDKITSNGDDTQNALNNLDDVNQGNNKDKTDSNNKKYNVVWIKNEFGVNEVDSLLAKQSNITDVKEITNGCLCCTLVGVLSESLYEILITKGIQCDRIIIETSGSAFPATLVQEINRIALDNTTQQSYSIASTLFNDSNNNQTTTTATTTTEKEQQQNTNNEQEGLQIPEKLPIYIDGVICVVDALNYEDYSDTSYTAKIQAQYTDIILLNKHELLSSSSSTNENNENNQNGNNNNNSNDSTEYKTKLDAIYDILHELTPDTPIIMTNKGIIDYNVVFGMDPTLYNKKMANLLNNNNIATVTNDTKSLLLDKDNNTNALSDVDVLHVEWVSKMKMMGDNNTTTNNTNNNTNTNNNIVNIYRFEKWLTTLSIYNVIRLKGLILLEMTEEQYNYILQCNTGGGNNNNNNNNNKRLFSLTTNHLISTVFPQANQQAQQQLNNNNNAAANTSTTNIYPLILNYVLGRWSFFSLPNYNNELIKIQQNKTSMMMDNDNKNNHKNEDNKVNIDIMGDNILLPLCTPSPLYIPQYNVNQMYQQEGKEKNENENENQNQNNLLYLHSRLTLFGKKGTLSTFNFLKMTTRHLPLSIRKQCCNEDNNNTNNTNNDNNKKENHQLHQQHHHHEHTKDGQCCNNNANDIINDNNKSSQQDIYNKIEQLPYYGGFITVLSSEHSHNHV